MPDEADGERGEQSTRDDTGPASLGDAEYPSWHQRRADALMDLVRRQAGRPGGADRYLVHVVVDAAGAGLLGGEPLDPATAARVRCDCSRVTHWVTDTGEPLHLGRKERTWSVAQLLCPHHHTLVHDGWSISGDVDTTLVFRRPGPL